MYRSTIESTKDNNVKILFFKYKWPMTSALGVAK